VSGGVDSVIANCRQLRPTLISQAFEHNMNRIEKLKNDLYSFEELDTLEKNATKLGDKETLELIVISRASKTAKGEKPKSVIGEDGKPLTKRARRDSAKR
jgi:hypothetical protein